MDYWGVSVEEQVHPPLDRARRHDTGLWRDKSPTLPYCLFRSSSSSSSLFLRFYPLSLSFVEQVFFDLRSESENMYNRIGRGVRWAGAIRMQLAQTKSDWITKYYVSPWILWFIPFLFYLDFLSVFFDYFPSPPPSLFLYADSVIRLLISLTRKNGFWWKTDS